MTPDVFSTNWTPEEIFIVSERAWRLFEQGLWNDAATLWRGVAAIAPSDRYSLQGLALCLQKLGRHDESLLVWNRLVAAAPGDADAVAGRCYSAIALELRAEAARDLVWLDRNAPEKAVRLRLLAEVGLLGKESPEDSQPFWPGFDN